MSTAEATQAAIVDTATPAIEARDVTVRFGGLVALNEVSLSVPPASIVGLVGPNGAGKTTLFGVFSGLLHPQGGEVYLAGRKITGAAPSKRARLGLARTFQQLELFMGLTVREHIILGYRVRNQRNRLWTDLFTAGALHPSTDDERARVDRLVDLLGLRAVANTAASVLPLGTARRVEVARALATGPSIVLLDEPSSGLDGHETAQLGAALRTVVDEEKVSLLLVEHDVAMVLGLSSEVAVLDFGVRIAYGTPDEIRNDPAVRAAYLGDDEAVEGNPEGEA
ncbi:MAG TPA: ABC transporter ATP-binding protein [Acidimicrobiia bacterium]|jgi:branched-chain amino acid transport system ATP-binding protein|nr:ABC transporter ATP-binding protein [Acidimicrobiia bacterium]